jgi:hypothetical protein
VGAPERQLSVEIYVVHRDEEMVIEDRRAKLPAIAVTPRVTENLT